MQTEDPGMRSNPITPLQQEHEQLKERVQWLESILHRTPAMVFTADRHVNRITWCNVYMERFTGFTLNEMHTLGPEFFRQFMHPDDFELTSIADTSFHNRKNSFGGVARVRPKGQREWRWVVGLTIPFRQDEQGEVGEVICAFLDLTAATDTHTQLADAMSELLRRQNESLLDKLTFRERDVLALAVKGLNNKEIAQQLNLSRYTVETHRKNIRLKLKVRNTTELVTIARNIGFQ
jgi:RNA polymerase sigma factor (sigma-70 family)